MEFCVCKIWAVALKWLGKTVVPEPHKKTNMDAVTLLYMKN